MSDTAWTLFKSETQFNDNMRGLLPDMTLVFLEKHGIILSADGVHDLEGNIIVPCNGNNYGEMIAVAFLEAEESIRLS